MKRKERANGVCNMNDKRVSVARRDKKLHLSPRGASGSLLTRAGGGGRRTREWLQTQLHEARAQGLKHADYTKSRESLGGHCIGPRVISCQIDLSFVFDPGTASELEKKLFYFIHLPEGITFCFLKRNQQANCEAEPDQSLD